MFFFSIISCLVYEKRQIKKIKETNHICFSLNLFWCVRKPKKKKKRNREKLCGFLSCPNSKALVGV